MPRAEARSDITVFVRSVDGPQHHCMLFLYLHCGTLAVLLDHVLSQSRIVSYSLYHPVVLHFAVLCAIVCISCTQYLHCLSMSTFPLAQSDISTPAIAFLCGILNDGSSTGADCSASSGRSSFPESHLGSCFSVFVPSIWARTESTSSRVYHLASRDRQQCDKSLP